MTIFIPISEMGGVRKMRIRPKKFVPRFAEGEEEEGGTLTLGEVWWRQARLRKEQGLEPLVWCVLDCEHQVTTGEESGWE